MEAVHSLEGCRLPVLTPNLKVGISSTSTGVLTMSYWPDGNNLIYSYLFW